VIVPVWRESETLLDLVRTIVGWPEVREVIVAIAEGSAEYSGAIEAAGALCLAAGRPNRGRQLNLGAHHAGGAWLLFHHSDTELTRPHVQALAALDPRPEIVGGAFYRQFDSRHPHCRWLDPIERWHNRSFGALYGDQSLFVRRPHFQSLGGFADIPLMEDVEFSKRLRRSGQLALLDPPITSSPRKHERRGAWKTTFTNAALILLYKLGAPPERLRAWYYEMKVGPAAPTSVLTQTHEN
jgi:rSAM/selenodomain-associated transferase 2